jgi:DNA-binding transcriptional LysR family regulator
MLDWDDLRFFLAIAEHGTLSGAAKALEVTQPTVGRRLTAFEERLGARLFARSGARIALSDVGRAVLSHAERMREHALCAETLASGRDAGVQGVVRVTAAEWVVRSLLSPRLLPLLSRHTRLTIELVADTRHLSLVMREADIALRPSRFGQQEIVQRSLGELRFGLYASSAYLKTRGTPDFSRGAPGHDFITFTDEVVPEVERSWLGALMADARTVARCNGREPMAQMAAAGLGIACLPVALAELTQGLVELRTSTPGPARKLWLGVHREARKTARIREVAQFLSATLGAALRETDV